MTIEIADNRQVQPSNDRLAVMQARIWMHSPRSPKEHGIGRPPKAANPSRRSHALTRAALLRVKSVHGARSQMAARSFTPCLTADRAST